MKIALFFRGALRPNPTRVIANTQPLIHELKEAGYDITTYVGTWPFYNGNSSQELINSKIYNHVLIEEEPSDSYIYQFVKRTSPINGHTTIPNVWKTYYLSNKIIQQIVQHDDYDIMIHSRPDVSIKFGIYLTEWISAAQRAYIRPRVDEAWWICDVFGVASTEIMMKAWNYRTEQELAERIDRVTISEEVLMGLMKDNGVETLPRDLEHFELDSNRHSH